MNEVLTTRKTARRIRASLKADCSKCFGLCCTALHIIASNDFPINKPAGVPCDNLQADYGCRIHSELRGKGFKGCTVFDCLGAGQAVSQKTFRGKSWRENRNIGEKMYQVFPIMEQIHEMIAYTAEALSYELPQTLAKELSRQLKELEALTELNADELAALDLVMYRFSLNELLISASDIIREKNMKNVRIRGRELNQTRADWMGRKVAGQDLRATNFRGAYLIAADLKDTDLRAVNFIGADLRDADFSGADLSASMFLTQMQINAAKGNNKTKLPFYLERPSHW